MQIGDIRIRSIEKESKIKGIASFTIDGVFAVHDVKIIEGDKGLFIAMPSKKTAEGEFRDICHPLTSAAREELQNTILEAYKKEKIEMQ